MASKNLGTLTLDLVAKVGGFVQGMDAAERKSAKWRSEVDKNLKSVGAGFAALTAASAGALTYIVQDLAQGSRELQQFARVSDSTTQEFQKLAYGASRYQVEQSKVADILKDTNDKIGDFLQTGGGPLADFFEDIAPAIGVTAEQFAGLSGPQALQLYVDSLEKASLSQKEMTFFMEAIASDASLLLPLLRDGGKEFKALGDEAERTGNVLSDVEIEQLGEISKSVDELTAQFTGMKNEVALAAVPAVNDLIDLLSDESTVEAAKTLGTAVVTTMTAAAEAIRGTIEVTKFLGEELAAAVTGPAIDDIPRIEDAIAKQEQLVNGLMKMPGFVEGRNTPLQARVQQEREELERLQDMYQVAQDLASTPLPEVKSSGGGKPKGSAAVAGGALGRDGGDEAEAAAKAADSIESLRDQYLQLNDAVLQANDDQIGLENARYERLTESLAAEYQAVVDANAATEELQAEHRQALEDAEYEHQSNLEAIRAEAREKELEAEAEKRQQLADGYSVLLDVVGSYYDGMEGKQAAYARVAISLGQALLDEDKRKALQGVIANTQETAMKAYNALAGIPLVGPALGAAAAGAVYVAGAASAARITGMAHDGIDSVPEDGTWLLQKGERVTTAETSAKLDGLLDRIDKNMDGPAVGGGAGGSAQLGISLAPGFIVDQLRSDDNFERLVLDIQRVNEG